MCTYHKVTRKTVLNDKTKANATECNASRQKMWMLPGQWLMWIIRMVGCFSWRRHSPANAEGIDLPVNHRREEFLDEAFVIGSELFSIAWLITFAVEIVWVESAYSLESLLVLSIGEMGICAFTVPADGVLIRPKGHPYRLRKTYG